MKQYILTIVKKIYCFLNKPGVAILILIIPAGVSISFSYNFDMQNYYTEKAIWQSVFEVNSTNLKKQLLFEIELELKKNYLELDLEVDTIANGVHIRPITSVPNRALNEWCIYIGKRSLKNLTAKKQCKQDIKSFICVKKEVNMY